MTKALELYLRKDNQFCLKARGFGEVFGKYYSTLDPCCLMKGEKSVPNALHGEENELLASTVILENYCLPKILILPCYEISETNRIVIKYI